MNTAPPSLHFASWTVTLCSGVLTEDANAVLGGVSFWATLVAEMKMEISNEILTF